MKATPRSSALALIGSLLALPSCDTGALREEGARRSGAVDTTENTTPVWPPSTGKFVTNPLTGQLIEEGVFNRELEVASAVPLTTGTLAVTSDATRALVSDADRASVFVVSLESGDVRSLNVGTEALPGKVAVDGLGFGYVILRGTNQILRVDLTEAAPPERAGTCRAPEGLALSPDQARIYVACRSGEFETLDRATLAPLGSVTLDGDLRDVVTSGQRVVVSRFRSAELLVLDQQASLLFRMNLGAGSQVAWRMLARSDGKVVVAHQTNFIGSLPSFGGSYYGGGGCFGSVSQPVVSVVDLDLALDPGQDLAALVEPDLPPGVVMRRSLPNAAGVVDVAIAADQLGVTAVVPGNALALEPTDAVFDVSVSSEVPDCTEDSSLDSVPEIPVSIVVDANGRTILQTREPALLRVEGQPDIGLSRESHANTGFRLFHMNTGAGTACVSCHPEGRDDGYVWDFGDFGLRRTQTLSDGVRELAPYHWDGSLPTFEAFLDEVLVGRMTLPRRPTLEEREALLDWLEAIPKPQALAPSDDPAVARGKALFESTETSCSVCHAGQHYTNNLAYDVGTGMKLVTPPLTGIALKGPYLHDGCASALEARFGICGGGDAHGKTSQLSDSEIGDLVAFLKTL
jgi:mono/diheme cytochrome c family protein